MFVLARLNRAPMSVLPGDDVCPYLLMANAHDGSLRLHVGFSAVRVVCANTLTLARNDRRSKLLQLRHTPGIKMALETIRETVDVAHRNFVASVEQFQRLARTGCDETTLKTLVAVVFAQSAEVAAHPDALDGEDIKSRVYPRVQALFENGRGANIAGVRGSLWGAVNAISEYVQYTRGADEARRLDATWFGTGAALNRRALDVAMKMAA